MNQHLLIVPVIECQSLGKRTKKIVKKRCIAGSGVAPPDASVGGLTAAQSTKKQVSEVTVNPTDKMRRGCREIHARFS